MDRSVTLDMAAKRRRKRSDRTTVEPARHGQMRCDDVLRTAVHDDGTVFQQRCIGGVHDGDLRHLPGPWQMCETTSETF